MHAHVGTFAHIYDCECTHKHAHVPAVYLFFSFERIDHFLCLLLAQRLLPLPISHLSPISLGMSVWIMVCFFFYVCDLEYVCVFALLQMSLFIDG